MIDFDEYISYDDNEPQYDNFHSILPTQANVEIAMLDDSLGYVEYCPDYIFEYVEDNE
jgi:hypothetical protein